MKFRQKSDELNRCALLISLSLNDPECYSKWSAIYEVTAFFVGEMDDLSYDEYWPLAEKIYGKDINAAGLIGKAQEWEQYEYEIKKLRAPKVMSSSDKMDSLQEDELEAMKSYCFLPQRYTLDADIFTNVCANMVEPNPNDPLDKRVMPDALDVPAAMGSDVALNLLVKAGNDRYPNYLEQVLKMREVVAESHEYWSSSLYGGWLFTLAPLLEEKEEGYPSFMTNLQWRTKNLESFLGSWTELKHDTILYAKQFGFAECGGDDDINVDDRGYVEPEPEFFARLQTLSKATMEGLDKLGFIDETDKEYLGLLSDLSGTLHDIAVKELQNQPLTDEEYELIKSYGGSLEHFWYGALYCDGNSNPEEGVINSNDMPVVADVATANGYCLEEAIGYPSKIYVVFPIDGELHIAAGAVSTYYQFVQPASERLTDSEWLDIYYNEEISQPGWTQSYR